MRYLIALAGGLFVLGFMALLLSGEPEVDVEALMRRCAASQPAWNGYQEDIKEIGAGPVAQWRGRPVAADVAAGEVQIVMLLESPWSGWDAALPVLLRTPEGQILRHASADRGNPRRTYTFILEPGTPMPPWIELQYPHQRKRLYLDGRGTWSDTAPDNGRE